MEVNIEQSWKEILEEEFTKAYFLELVRYIKDEYKARKIYPPAGMIFNAFTYTPYDNVKVVILGQDPYHGIKQANGLSFSVNKGVSIPPSLQNIYKELKNDIGKETPNSGDLSHWARQGVLLLNSTLTVRENLAGSHQGKGWEIFTDAIINILSEKKDNLVFILWGKYAQEKGKVINRSKHLVIESPHPSPFAANRGFFGSKPFSKTNEYLRSKGISTINW